jgi:hypothetical protein
LRSNRWRNNGSPSSPGCEDGSACPNSIPDVPRHRSCHEKRRSPRGNVIIRNGTAMLCVEVAERSTGMGAAKTIR